MYKIFILICMLLFVTPAVAKNKNKDHSAGKSFQSGSFHHAQAEPGTNSSYSHTSVQSIIDSYFRPQPETKKNKKATKKKKNIPPGLQKKVARGGELPPGWQKKVARGEILDVLLYSRSVRLPADLLSRLPAVPPGTELLRLEDRVFRILNDSREILDIFTIHH